MRAYFTCLIAFALSASPIPVLAQSIAQTFDEVPGLVRDGQRVTVTDTSGRRVTGAIANLSAASITVLTGRSATRVSIDAPQVSRIERREFDSLKNGIVLGAVAGGVGFYVAMEAALGCDGCHWGSAWAPVGIAMMGAGMGAGIGVTVDALVNRRRVIYLSANRNSTTLHAVPLVGRRKGALLAIRF